MNIALNMESNKIEKIIVKYLSNQATFAELDALDNWIKNPENEKLFQSYIRTNYAIDYNLKKFNAAKIKLMLSEEIAKEKKVFRLKKIRQRILYGAAASIIICSSDSAIAAIQTWTRCAWINIFEGFY